MFARLFAVPLAVVLAVVLVVSSPSTVRAEPANLVMLKCEGKGIALGDCLTYLRGVWDGMMVVEYFGGTELLCPRGSGVMADQMRRIFLAWGNKNPQTLSYEASVVASAAFIDAFPCAPTSDQQTKKKTLRQ